MVTKKLKHKNEDGTVVEVDLGTEAKNVSEDADHRFVSDADKTNWNDANSKKHSHSNKTVLDKITQALLDNWSAAYTHVSDAVKHVTAAERTNWNDANTKKHSHSNKSVLDTITQAMMDKLARGEFIEIPDASGTDLNEYINTGIYYYSSPLVGETLAANSPTEAYVMFVFPVGFFYKKILQVLLCVDPIIEEGNANWYLALRARTYDIDSSSWGNWYIENFEGSLKACTLTASGWSSSAPYTQTVNVEGIRYFDNPIIALDIPNGTTAANESAMLKAYSCLSNATTDDGTITFKCISKKPTTNFAVSIKL